MHLALIRSPVADCNLAEFFRLVPGSTDNKSLLRSFHGCLSAALAYLHDSGVRHKDIKPQNVLVEEGNALLTDSGISLDFAELSRSTTSGDTPKTRRYCAPKVGAGEKRNSSSDIWSLGCVFVEIMTVLRGEIIDALKRFLKTHGSLHTNFYMNEATISQWIAKLTATTSDEYENMPSRTILEMLQMSHDKRPTARMVVKTLGVVEAGVVFCGICCRRDEASTYDPDSPAYDTIDENGILPSQIAWGSSQLCLRQPLL